jgi:RNA polymerase sigma-70 factor (ECF subfamily)
MVVARDKLPLEPELTSRFLAYVYSQFDSALRGYLMRSLGNQADADDFVQDVYLRIARQETVQHIDCAKAFVFKTAQNLLCDRSRRLATRLQQASVCCDDVPLTETCLDPAGRIADEERLERLLEALDQTSANAQEAFRLSRLDGLSYAEIAERMEVSVSMVEKHISAVLRALDTVDD